MSNITGKIARDKLAIKIKEYISIDVFDIRYAESNSCEVRDPKVNGQYLYVMKYFPWCKRIVIWSINAYKCDLHQVVETIELQYDSCNTFYEKRRNGKIDKILVIHEDFLYDFLDDYVAFMRFNENDSNYIATNNQNNDWCNREERKDRCVIQKARDSKFRKSVLEQYDFQCAICRCNIPQLLEAAHERDYEVRNTLKDEVEHGICLCRNHHAMYDKHIESDENTHLIDINKNEGTICINDERIKAMPWYKEFLSTYGRKIIMKNKI